MKELPMIVAQTEVGKTVKVIIWRNKKELIKTIKLGRLETSEDFQTKKPAKSPKISFIDSLKINVRLLENKDIEQRNLPQKTTGLVITKIQENSPVNFLEVNDIIVEAQKQRIRTINQLENILNSAVKMKENTILIAIYNNQNQRRYIGVKLK